MGDADQQVVVGKIGTTADRDVRRGDRHRLPAHALPSYVRRDEGFDAVSRPLRRQLRGSCRREYAETAIGGDLHERRAVPETIPLSVHTQILPG